jgi:FtsP/CotA-like multicopper oxidase with cupredoxin domain
VFLLVLAIAAAPAFAQTAEPGAGGVVEKTTAAKAVTAKKLVEATGSPFVEPQVIQSKNGLLEATLNICLTRSQIAGRVIETGTYNGVIPGPTFRIKAGDTLKIGLINNLTLPGIGQACPPLKPPIFIDCGRSPATLKTHDDASHDPGSVLRTNIHTHGLQVSPVGNSDNPYIDLGPTQGCRYEIKVPGPVTPPDPFRPTQPAGLYWYHPHRHMSTSKQSWSGLAGAIIVEGEIDRVPDVAAARERLLVLQELWLDDKGHVPAGVVIPVGGPKGLEVPFTTNPAVPTNIYYTVNGIYQPRMSIQPGETQRWRILNASPHRVYKLHLEGHRYRQISQDGIAFAEAVEVDQEKNPIILFPGNRVEIVIQGVTGAATAKIYSFKALPYDQGHPAGALPEAILATLAYSGPVVTGRQLPTKLVATPPDVTTLTGPPQKVVFSGKVLQEPVQFFLNGQQFTTTMTPITGQVGKAVEWTLVNEDVFQHPFHIHVNPFQVVEINGRKVDKPIWWDTFGLPPRDLRTGKPSEVKIRMRFRSDIAGKTVFHCHFLPHEDNGMMSVFELVP